MMGVAVRRAGYGNQRIMLQVLESEAKAKLYFHLVVLVGLLCDF